MNPWGHQHDQSPAPFARSVRRTIRQAAATGLALLLLIICMAAHLHASGSQAADAQAPLPRTLDSPASDPQATDQQVLDELTTTLTQIVIRQPDQLRSAFGRILVQAQDGGLLFEERNGKILSLTPALLQEVKSLAEPFAYMNREEMSADLIALMGPGYNITSTEHYVVCSNSSEAYAEYTGRLLEQVYEQFFDFFGGESRPFVKQPVAPLPVILFGSADHFRTFASRQHPDVSFDETPGYYSVRDNQILMMDLTAAASPRTAAAIRRELLTMPRQVATVVHEAVHQLAFNSGLQVRMADNPVWLSEGLAMWFEPTSSRSPLMWSRPGQVNPVHQPLFLSCVTGSDLQLPLEQLLSSDTAFQNAALAPAAYSESWALTAWLIRQHPEAMDELLRVVSERQPLQRVTAEQRIDEFRRATGKSPDEIQPALIQFISRLRVPRQ